MMDLFDSERNYLNYCNTEKKKKYFVILIYDLIVLINNF